MRALSQEEIEWVSAGGVSGETIGCAVGGAIGASLGGNLGNAVGCVTGAAIANGNYSNTSASYFGSVWSLWNRYLS